MKTKVWSSRPTPWEGRKCSNAYRSNPVSHGPRGQWTLLLNSPARADAGDSAWHMVRPALHSCTLLRGASLLLNKRSGRTKRIGGGGNQVTKLYNRHNRRCSLFPVRGELVARRVAPLQTARNRRTCFNNGKYSRPECGAPCAVVEERRSRERQVRVRALATATLSCIPAGP
jgi:hypothetical protein